MEYLYTLAGTVAMLLISVLYNAHRGPLSHLPGPWYTKFTSYPLTIQWMRGNRTFWVHQLHQKYGPVVRLAPNEADISEISAKQTIYATKEQFTKSVFYKHLTGGNDQSIFGTSNTEQHRYIRRLLSGPMTETSLKSVEPIVRGRINVTIQRMAESMEARGFADVYHWALLMATDVIGELSFGESFNTLEDPGKSQYVEDLRTLAEAGAFAVAFPRVLQFMRKVPFATRIPNIKKTISSVRRLAQYANESLSRYHRLIAEDPVNVKPTLFTKVFRAEEEETLTFDEINGNARSYIVAGSDTTAHTLTYLIWAVCKHPRIRDKLVSELKTKLPADLDSVSDADLRQLPYLTCVIEETLRLYAALPSALPRTVPQQGANLGGYNFPAGVVVSSQAYTLHRDPKIHPNPDMFDPERWAEGWVTKQMRDANLAWGAGARVCIGMHLAKMELRLVTALFFRVFPNAKVSAADGMSDQDMDHKIFFLLIPKGGRCYIEADEPQ